MDNYIIIGTLVLIAFFVIRTMVKRAGRKGCCGSAGDYRVKEKKLKTVIATKVFTVEGMHCEKCSNRVMEVVNDIPGLSGKVDPEGGTVTVSYAQEVPDDLIKARIQRAGYTVTEIR